MEKQGPYQVVIAHQDSPGCHLLAEILNQGLPDFPPIIARAFDISEFPVRLPQAPADVIIYDLDSLRAGIPLVDAVFGQPPAITYSLYVDRYVANFAAERNACVLEIPAGAGEIRTALQASLGLPISSNANLSH